VLEATYFDGKSSKAQAVKIAFRDQHILIHREGAPLVKHPLLNAHLDESFKGAARRIDLGAGALLEIPNRSALQLELNKQGLTLSTIEKVQNSWTWVAASLATLIAVLALSYLFAIPFAAKHVAAWLPESVEKKLGEEAWPVIETQLFKSSKLAPERQASIRDNFTKLTARLTNVPAYTLEFRSSSMGPNAIAVPGGRLVLTDELVNLAPNDQAVMGVLLHELGHIKQRHSMRNIIQVTAVSAILALWLGDVSTIITFIPATIANMKYSRDFENEADDFAIQSLKTLKIPGEPVAALFEAMEKAMNKEVSKEKSSGLESIFSSHPVTADRIKKFREINP
jgi:Zn-dependent protease with chaperone function